MNTPPNLVRSLRALVPQRRLSYHEAERIAELQANVLREQLGITEAEFPESVIERMPRIQVRRRHGLPVSGLTHWHNGRWLIMLNADEPEERQRFSLCHELKHVLDHSTKIFSCWDEAWRSSDQKAETLADYFAGCLLAPKRHIKREWGTNQDVQILADTFGISTRAMTVRLSQLGLLADRPRCIRPTARWQHFGSIYYRQRESVTGVAA